MEDFFSALSGRVLPFVLVQYICYQQRDGEHGEEGGDEGDFGDEGGVLAVAQAEDGAVGGDGHGDDHGVDAHDEG